MVGSSGGYTQSEDVGTVMQVFQLPKALAYPLFYKLVAPNSSSITRDAILTWFDEKNVIQVLTLCGVSMTFVSNRASKRGFGCVLQDYLHKQSLEVTCASVRFQAAYCSLAGCFAGRSCAANV